MHRQAGTMAQNSSQSHLFVSGEFVLGHLPAVTAGVRQFSSANKCPGPIAALGRSWRLSSGSRWRVIGIQALLGILNLVLSLLIGGIFGGLAAAGQTEQPGQFGVSTVVQTLVNLASTIIWAPVEWIAFTILYYDLRVRKEAFDLQLAAEALPQS